MTESDRTGRPLDSQEEATEACSSQAISQEMLKEALKIFQRAKRERKVDMCDSQLSEGKKEL